MKHACVILLLAALTAGAALAQDIYPAPTATYDATIPKIVVTFDIPGLFPPAGFACWDIRLTRFSPDPAEYAFTYHQAARSVHLYLDAPMPEGAYWIDATILDADGDALAYAERGEFDLTTPANYRADIGLMANYGSDWITSFQIFNPTDRIASVTLSVYRNEDGHRLLEYYVKLLPKTGEARFIHDLLAEMGTPPPAGEGKPPDWTQFIGGAVVTADAPVVITSWTFGAVGTVPTTVQARPADPTMKRR